MFEFLKKKDTNNKINSVSNNKEELSEEEKKERIEKISSKKEFLKTFEKESEDLKEVGKIYEEIGLLESDIDIDNAIVNLEKSLEYSPSMGDGYKKLMNLYNKKRAEAAQKGDDDGIEYWMGKMDEMRQIAKKLTITGQ